jgi:outer membrane protein OmpA-like peptidoglycan-associated protein
MRLNRSNLKNSQLGAALLAAFALLSVAWMPADANAQDLNLPDIQLERFRPAPGPSDYLDVYGTGVPGHLEWDASFYLGYADNPMQISTRDYPYAETVDVQTSLSLLGSVGLFERFEVGLLLPLTVLQTSQGLQPILPPGSDKSTDLSTTGLNDWRLSGKYQILNPLEDELGLAVVGALYLPLATSDTLSSDAGFGGELLAAADYWLWRGIRMGVNVGYRYRAMNETFRASTIGDELLWGLAFAVPLFVRDLDAILEFDGAISVASKGGRTTLTSGEVPAEVKLAGRYRLTDDWTLTAGAGSGLTNGIGSPDFRLFLGIGGYWVYGGKWSMDYKSPAFYGEATPCPDGSTSEKGCPELDTDGDGVPDHVDRCPGTPPGTIVLTDGCPDEDLDGDGIPNSVDKCAEDPEDYDDFEDGDGCPDPDNDGDGIVDTADDCDNQPENFNGFVDKDGCPDDPSQKVVVTKDKIIIVDKVHFETGKATIRQESYAILDAVTEVLNENPQIELLRVEGHTDDRGSASFNQKLSQKRADSVRQYLVEHGIDASRLTAVGYGEVKPIADNATAEGRGKNRRVEFTILESASSVDE